ncbi:unnamed protein product [Cochlearia groenlandica]
MKERLEKEKESLNETNGEKKDNDRVGILEGIATKGKKAATVNATDAESQAKRDDDGSKEKDPVRKGLF